MDAPDPMDEIRASFFIECEELLESLQDALELIQNGQSDDETINVAFRAVHSIKGGAGAFGLEELVRFAHCFETVLEALRSEKLAITPDIAKISFQSVDHLSDLVRCSRDNEAPPTTVGQKLFEILEESVSGLSDVSFDADHPINFEPMALDLNLSVTSTENALEQDDERIFHITFAPYMELYETGNEPFKILSRLQYLGVTKVNCYISEIPDLARLEPETPYLSWAIELRTLSDQSEIDAIFEFVEGLCDLTIAGAGGVVISSGYADENISQASQTDPKTIAQPIPPSKEIEKTLSQKQLAVKSVVRVDLDRIERLVNLVGELVINQAMLSESLETAGLSRNSEAMNSLEEFQRLTRDLQDGVMRIRAQPVKSLFQRMSRIVREASVVVGKDVQLTTQGETTEVDKTVIEGLADPLTHMIRNAVDHGLETLQGRAKAGKPIQGCITLSATHKSGRVIIEVSDDGAGIDRARVKQVAVDKGLIDQEWELTDSEIDNLLFMPGFSTSEIVSDISGRGIGMDVVHNAIQSLGGRITITSIKGKGTTFSISLPLTLAVLDGMVVQVADETLVLPINVISETLTITSANFSEVILGSNVVRIRGNYIPIYDLGVALGYRTKKRCYLETVALVVENDDQCQVALIVDDICDQRQVVIKGLDDSFYRAPGIAAATILGDGKIALILDPIDIIASTKKTNNLKRA